MDTPELIHYRLVRQLVDDLTHRDPVCLGMAVETIADLEVACRTFGWRLVISYAHGQCRVHVTTELGVEIVNEGQSLFGSILHQHFASSVADSYAFALDHLNKVNSGKHRNSSSPKPKNKEDRK